MIKAIIIDDERKARLTLKQMLDQHCNNVEILSLAASVDEAYDEIKKHNPDLIFLDIEMPGANGFELLKKFDSVNFKVIFTTAYNEYAIQAIKFSAIDYLLKPIDVDELIEAIGKIDAQEISHKENIKALFLNLSSAYIRLAVPHSKGLTFINLNDIISFHSDRNYTIIKLLDKKQVLTTKNLGKYEELLSSVNFFRVHHSHLINMKHVKEYTRGAGGHVHMIDGSEIEISRRRKSEFLEKFDYSS